MSAPARRDLPTELAFALATSLLVPLVWVGRPLRLQATPGLDSDALWRALAEEAAVRGGAASCSQACLPTALAAVVSPVPGRGHAMLVVVALVLAGLGGWLVARRFGRAPLAVCALCALLAQLGPWMSEAVRHADLAAMGVGALLLGLSVPPLAVVAGLWSAPIAFTLTAVGLGVLSVGWRDGALRRAGAWQALAVVAGLAVGWRPTPELAPSLRAPAYVTASSAVFPLPEVEAAPLRERSRHGRWVSVAGERAAPTEAVLARSLALAVVGVCAAMGAWFGGRTGWLAAAAAAVSVAALLVDGAGAAGWLFAGSGAVVALGASALALERPEAPRWRSRALHGVGALAVLALWVVGAPARGEHVVMAPDPALAPLRGGIAGDVLVFPSPEAPWRAGAVSEERWRVELAGVGRGLATGADADAARVALAAATDVPVDMGAAARAWEVRSVDGFSKTGAGWRWLVVDTSTFSAVTTTAVQTWLAPRVGMPVARSPGRLLYARDALSRSSATSAPRPAGAPPSRDDPPR